MILSPLIVMALESEGQSKLDNLGYEIVYCGVGKVNASYYLTCALQKAASAGNRYPRVINLGSAGSPCFSKGSLVAASSFVQRDMDATGLGYRHGETPFDPGPYTITFPKTYNHLPHGICSSGDSFLQGPCPVKGQIIDMEAYALAKVCFLESIPFSSVKYITDGADGHAHSD